MFLGLDKMSKSAHVFFSNQGRRADVDFAAEAMEQTNIIDS